MRSFAPLMLCLALAGCAAASASPTVDEFELSKNKAMAAVTDAAGGLDRPDVKPVKPLRKDCKVCKGEGWYLSGDGIARIECKNCIGPPVNLSSLPPLSRPSAESDEVAFGETTLPEQQARVTLHGLRKLCDCQETGICTCGVNCACAIKGERDGVVMFYTMDNCPHCVTCEAKLKAAVKAAKLPITLRIVKTKDAPSWVRSFPTLHWTTPDGKSRQTHDAQVLIDFYNPKPKATTYSQPTVMSGFSDGSCSSGACYGGSCSSGACYSGGCSSGSCGSGFGRGWRGWGGGFRFGGGGGGCSSCGR